MANTFSLKKLLEKNGIDLKKSLGQNFLIDDYYPEKIAESASEISTGVIEIGPGAGALTRHLCRHFKRVAAIELDKRMKPLLDEALAEFDNYEIIYGDVLKVDLAKIIDDMKVDSVSVVANLPYYITTPIIMKLLESGLSLKAITVMVQKEVADRLCADLPGKNAGAVTVMVNYYARPEILFKVPRSCFLPVPKVDSAVIRLSDLRSGRTPVKNEKNFKRLVSAAFNYRRKTFVNSVNQSLGLGKPLIINALEKREIIVTARAEELSLEDFAFLSDLLFDGGK